MVTDVEDVKFVINFDYPSNSEDYVHRIGRTGRSQRTGTAYTFFTPSNANKAADLVAVLKEAKQVINPKLQEMAENRGWGGGNRVRNAYVVGGRSRWGRGRPRSMSRSRSRSRERRPRRDRSRSRERRRHTRSSSRDHSPRPNPNPVASLPPVVTAAPPPPQPLMGFQSLPPPPRPQPSPFPSTAQYNGAYAAFPHTLYTTPPPPPPTAPPNMFYPPPAGYGPPPNQR